jgi:hypothetical protein
VSFDQYLALNMITIIFKRTCLMSAQWLGVSSFTSQPACHYFYQDYIWWGTAGTLTLVNCLSTLIQLPNYQDSTPYFYESNYFRFHIQVKSFIICLAVPGLVNIREGKLVKASGKAAWKLHKH